MWRSLLHLGLIAELLTGPGAFAATLTSRPTTAGPEARILWKTSQFLYKKGDCANAITPLRRLIDHYPGYPQEFSYREAHYELGRCYFLQSEYNNAIPALKAYLEGPGSHPHHDQALLLLGKAKLRTHHVDEAYLVSRELERSTSDASRIEAWILRSQALMASKKYDQARTASDSAQRLAEKLKSKSLESEAGTVALELKTRVCGMHPSKNAKMDEAQVRAVLRDRGTCLNEALLAFRKVLSYRDARSSDQALEWMTLAYADYQKACQNPPNPPPLKPKDRTPAQLAEYRRELIDDLVSVCGKKREMSRQLISNWLKEKPAPKAFVRKRLNPLEESLK